MFRCPQLGRECEATAAKRGETTPLAENLSGGFVHVASPDGTRVAYDTYEGGSCLMTVASIDGTDVRTFEAPEGLVYTGPWWSPDGSKLLYVLSSGENHDVGNLFVHDLSSDRRTQITNLELSSAYWFELSADFGPDGGSVIFHLPRSSAEVTKWDVWSVPVTGGEPMLVLRNAAFPRYFPNGQIVFVAPGSSAFDGRVIAIAGADGSRRTLVEASEPGYRWPSISPDGSRVAYRDGDSIFVVDVSTGESVMAGVGGTPEWLDDDRLIVSPG